MSRAQKRLAEIAKANEPAFSGPQWWLADPSVKSDPPPSAPVQQPASAPSHAAPAPEPVRVAESPLTIIEAPAPKTVDSAPVAVAEAVTLAASAPQAQPEAGAGELVTRMSGLKERFLWLGRRSRTLRQE